MVAIRRGEPWTDAAEIRRGAFNLIAAHGIEGAQALARSRAAQPGTGEGVMKWRRLAKALEEIAVETTKKRF